MARTEPRLIAVETVLKALADKTRLRILALLKAGEICVCHVHGSLGIPQPKASRHLAYLRRAGLVQTRRQGLWVYYRLADPGDPVLQTLLSMARHCLEHLPSSARDRKRLKQKSGCCDVAAGGAEHPVFPCCTTDGQGSRAGHELTPADIEPARDWLTSATRPSGGPRPR